MLVPAIDLRAEDIDYIIHLRCGRKPTLSKSLVAALNLICVLKMRATSDLKSDERPFDSVAGPVPSSFPYRLLPQDFGLAWRR